MNCQRTRDAFPDLLDERSPSATSAEARAHLAGCADCQRELAALHQTATALDAMPKPPPSPRLRKNFYAMLEAEKRDATATAPAAPHPTAITRASRWRFIFAPIGACAFLALGFFTGRQLTPVQFAEDTATRAELKQLRDQVNKMGQLVGISLLQQQQGPANDRLRGVLAAAQTDHPSDKILDDLIGALAFDPNANIRLRALEALTAALSSQVGTSPRDDASLCAPAPTSPQGRCRAYPHAVAGARVCGARRGGPRCGPGWGAHRSGGVAKGLTATSK